MHSLKMTFALYFFPTLTCDIGRDRLGLIIIYIFVKYDNFIEITKKLTLFFVPVDGSLFSWNTVIIQILGNLVSSKSHVKQSMPI